MKSMERVRARLTAVLPAFVFFLCILQPILDSISFWMAELELSNTLTLLLRFGVLGLTLLLGFCLSRRKWVYWTAAGVLVFLAAGHIFALYQAGIANLISDLTNYVRVVQMPLMTICLITFLKENEDCYRALKRGFVACIVIILAVLILSNVTHTEPHTYMDGKGYIGWFNNTNSQSAILCILVPVAMAFLYQQRGLKSPLFWLVTLGGFTAMYLLGPRLSYFGIFASAFGLGISMILIRPANWKRAIAFFCAALIFLALLPVSPMVEHQKIYEEVQNNRQNSINQMLEEFDLPALDEPGISQEELARRQELWVEALTPIYEFYAPDFVEMFGAKRTIEMHNYTYYIRNITGLRPKKLKFAALLMDASPASARVFGLELSRFTVNGNNYDVENDFHGIYYLYGGVGLAAMLAFLLFFLYLIAKALIKDAKTYFTLDAAAWGIGLICTLLHVYNTAGVLRRPNASFYLSAILAAVYYLVVIKQYPKDLKPQPETR